MMFGKSKENPMEKDTKDKKTLKSKTKSNVINTNPQLPGVNEQGSAVAKDPIIEKVLSLSQRRQRAMVMRKNEPRMERARERAKKTYAPEKRLMARAEVAARNAVRKKFAGQRGVEYATLSPSDKIMVDKLIDKKTALIKKIATRLYPKIRKAETERVAGLHSAKAALGGAAEVKKGALSQSPLMQSVDLRGLVDALLTEEMDAKKDKLLRMGLGDKDKLNQYRQALKDPDTSGKYVVLRKHLLSMLEKLFKVVTDDQTMYQKTQSKLQKERDYPSDKVAESLQHKSLKSGIATSTLAEVFNRGYAEWKKSGKTNKVTAEQYAFARVNSFISGGKARSIDADLVHEGLIGDALKNAAAQALSQHGTIGKAIAKKITPKKIKEEATVETKPKLKDKTVKREINTINVKGADPQSMTEKKLLTKIKNMIGK